MTPLLLAHLQFTAVYGLNLKDYAGNPNIINNTGLSALTLTLKKKNTLLFDLLLNHPDFIIDIRKNNEGKTVLHYILCMKDYSSTQLIQLTHHFIQQGGDCNMPDREGNTPLILACLVGHGAIVELLLQQPYLNINAKNKKGVSVLDCAVLYGTVNLVKALLAYGAAPDTLLNAFNQAVHFNKDSMAEMLFYHAKAQGNELFVNQALARAIDKYQQKTIDSVQKEYGAV
jgi:ankyrin repeat protein